MAVKATLLTHQHFTQAAYGYLLGQFGDALEVVPGEEFRVAVQEAVKVICPSLLNHSAVED